VDVEEGGERDAEDLGAGDLLGQGADEEVVARKAARKADFEAAAAILRALKAAG